MRVRLYVNALKGSIGKPRQTSVAGVVALLLSCFYLYLLSAHVSSGADEPASLGPVAIRSSDAEDWLTASPTATRTASPTKPPVSPTVTSTYTPISYTPAPAYIVYTVQAGDTLSGIARRFNTTVQAVMEYNNLTSDLINIGQELLIPGGGAASTPVPTSAAAKATAPTITSTPLATPTEVSSAATATSRPTSVSRGTPVSNERLVVAFYYAWYGLDEWAPSRVPDIPTVPYESSDHSTIVRHVEQAQRAGIDGFAVAWYGPQTPGNQTETNLQTTLGVAGQRGFRATVDFETRSPFYRSQADVVEALRYLISNHADHPAFLRYEGKPVVFFWAIQDVFTAEGQSAIDAWASIRGQVDPGHDTLWIAEGPDIEFLRVFDGHHLYTITWNPPVDVDITLGRWGNNVRDYNAEHGTQKLWVATVMPGYNDLRIEGRANRFARERRNGAYYRDTWEAAINSSPDLVVITSFNEWREGTQIEPSVSYGSLYLELTSEFSQVFKAGGSS